MRDDLRREEGELLAFFEAGRSEAIEPPAAFLNAVLADAAAVRPSRARQRNRRRTWPDIGALLRPIGGWSAAAALVGCLAIGLLAGALGAGSELAAGALWPDAPLLETAADSLNGFFDLTTTEG